MTAVSSILDPSRLRVAIAGLALAFVGALWALRPPSSEALVLYAAGEGPRQTAQAFTRATGVPVTVVRLFTGPMLARISAEGRRPSWSLAWFDGDISAATLDRSGLLAHGMTPEADWTPLGRALLPRNGAWTPVGVSLAAVEVSLRRSPRRDGVNALGMADPALSGAAYPQIAGLLDGSGGWPAGRVRFERWAADRLSVSATSPDVVSRLLDGRISRGLIQSSTAYSLADHRPSVRLRPSRPAYALPSVIVQAAGLSPRRRAKAALFVRYALSPTAVRARLTDGRVDAYVWPVTRLEATPPAIMPSLETLEVRRLDPYRWGAVQAAVTDWFETRVARR